MEKHWSHETPSGNGIPFREVGHCDEPIPETTRSLQRRESSLASSRLESAIDWTLEDWANRIKNIGGDVPIDKFAEMLFDGPALNDSSAAVKRGNTTFEPLSYSIIDRDERSYQARNRNGNDITSEGLEPSSVSWRLSPEDISLYRSRVLDDSTNKRLYVSSTNNQECTKSAERSLMSRTNDLMDRIKSFPSDVSGCDMADMLLPPPDGKSTKERLAKDSSDFSDVPNISTITDLLKAGLSSEELITKLLDGVKSPDNKGRRSSSVPGSRDGCVSPSRIPRPISPKLKQGASLSQKENMPSMKKASEKEPDITDSSGFEEPFVPMSYSIIDQDEESILKKYQLANDITIIGVENSNISWQLNSSDISLFREDGKSTSFESFQINYGRAKFGALSEDVGNVLEVAASWRRRMFYIEPQHILICMSNEESVDDGSLGLNISEKSAQMSICQHIAAVVNRALGITHIKFINDEKKKTREEKTVSSARALLSVDCDAKPRWSIRLLCSFYY